MPLAVARRAARRGGGAANVAAAQRGAVRFDGGALARCAQLFAEAEVGEADVPTPIEQHVVRLQVPVNVPEVVDALYGERHLGEVEFRRFLRQTILLNEESHEVATREELHDEK